MSHEIMFDVEGIALALFARGTGRVQSIWHQSMTGSPVIDVPTLDPEGIEERLAPEVYLVSPVDPETFDPCVGLSLIKARGFPGRLGVAGGHKRTSWTPAQPRHILESLGELRSLGATMEGVFWLAPGRFYVEGALPVDDTTRGIFGQDAHDVRYCAVADFTGGGRDFLMVSMTRVVCANTSAVAKYDANKRGSMLRIGHSKGIEDRWAIDAPAFLGDYSGKLRKHAETLRALGGKTVDGASLAGYFQAVLGGEPLPSAAAKVHTSYRWKMNALRAAWTLEAQDAQALGIRPDSARVAYEAVTRALSHGGEVTGTKIAEETGSDWRPDLFNGARNATGRALALAGGSLTTDALALALAI